jgi:hypothetical protein
MSAIAIENVEPQETPRRPLVGLDPEAVRYGWELRLLERVRAHPRFDELASGLLSGFDPARIRRELMASSLRLTESMAPNAHRLAAEAQRLLGLEGALEIYQSSGPENAAMHHCRAPILVEIQGRMLSLLDDAGTLGVLGHELGHYLAHGPTTETGRQMLAARVLARRGQLPRELVLTVDRMVVAGELTADRFGLLVTQDLDAMLRVEMVATTGLPAEALTWDTRAYLGQCTELMEACLAGTEETLSTTHPEHNLRAYALFLYSETREYQALTGRGPGTRALAEVDATLDRILGRSELDATYSPLEAPPPELHECALAGSVLVGMADGELADEELEAIERVFAPLVSGWEAYLEVEHARERFAETAPVLRGGGPDLLRALFNLLTHVMGADGVIDDREVGAILAIGQHLGARPLFERWMVATLRALGVELEIVDVAPLPMPLPARRDEVLEALDAFIDGVERRGGGTITARRLVRLVGHEALTPEALGAFEGAFVSRAVETKPALDRVRLDDLIELFPKPRVEVAAATAAPALAESRAALLKGLARLRDQLISGDGRSPSVRLRAVRAGRSFDLFALEQISVGMAERALAQVQAGRQARLVDPSEAGAHRGAEACVRALAELERTHRDRLEESGSNDLYLGHLFLSGAIGHEGAVAGYPIRAPLILYPVDLVRDGRGAQGFRLCPRKDEAPVVNQSLLRLVFNKKRFAFPDSLAEELDELVSDPSSGGDALIAKLAELGLDAKREARVLSAFESMEDLDDHGLFLTVDEHAVLGLFPQSSSDLLQDYEALLKELSDPAVDLDTTLAAARLLLPAAFRAEGRPEDDRAGHPLIVADPAQREVLDECRRCRGVVVDGPPGTGKSQVIANLVLDAVRRGERVAVVCEKRAALDVVYQRVEGLGVGHALAVVHDVHEDRKALYGQIARRIEEFEPLAFDAEEASSIDASHREAEAELDGRSALLRAKVAKSELTVGQIYALRSSVDGAGIDAEAIGALSQDELEALLGALEGLHPLRDLWGPESPFRAPAGAPPRASMAALDEGALRAIEAALTEAEEAATAYEAALAGAEVKPEAIDRATPALEADREARRDRSGADAEALYLAALAHAGDEAIGAELAAASAEASRAAAQLSSVQEPVAWPVTNELISSVAILRRWSGRLLRFFIWSWWVSRGVVRRAVRAHWPEEAGAPLEAPFLDRMHARVVASKAWTAAKLGLEALGAARLLPRTGDELGPRVALAERLHAHAVLLHHHAPALAAVGLGGPTEAARPGWDDEVDRRLLWAARLEALRASLAEQRPYFPWLAEAPPAAELAALRARFGDDARRLVQADVQIGKVSAIAAALLPCLDDLARLPAASVADWQQAVLYAWATKKLDALEKESPALARLGAPEDDAAVAFFAKRLGELEATRSAIETKRVMARLDAAPFLHITPAEKHKRRTPEQACREEILKEVRKKRSVMALRTFVRKFAARGLLDVVPVWLLSPETMTILFPREPLFDLVVFDEASQCTVESGLPVLLRARRVVIAGDEKQMPPTSFFKLGAGSGDDDEEAGDAAESAREMLEEESLLTLARTRLEHAGLKWHYRCHDESLIAFSNHAMYAGELHTIPSTRSRAAADALRWVAVPDGQYEQGANEPEARRVVDLIHELLGRDDPPTVGVVTFNLKQRRAILDAIEQRVAEDAAFADLWHRALAQERIDERPFVKNLESVQGDERDVIVFSLGHAPVARKRRGGGTDLYVPARFGPLGQRGGERRLNVAISRARLGCYIVSSFEPGLLSAGRSQNQGPKLFRDYLEFAHDMSHGRRAQAERVLDRVREGSGRPKQGARALPISGYLPLSAQVALALEEAGIPHDVNVGASEFRVPVAVYDPADPHRYALAILLDEGDDDARAFEAYVHRPAVLRTRGWEVLHVTAATWARRRASVLDAIGELVPGAHGALHSEAWRGHRERLRERPVRAVSRA